MDESQLLLLLIHVGSNLAFYLCKLISFQGYKLQNLLRSFDRVLMLKGNTLYMYLHSLIS